MPATSEMLEAHVKFEIDRWHGDGLAVTIDEEVSAAYEWLRAVKLNDVLDKGTVVELFRSYIREVAISDELAAMLARMLKSAHAAASVDETMLGDLIPVASYDRVVATVIDLTDLRETVTTQVTTSEVYSQLISHVLYQGIKNYLQAENLIARKVPGASTLMRMGQSAISTAAPKLEKAVDKQLTSFVNSNIQDTIRDSKQYLDKVLDKEVLTAVANEVWETNAKSSVAELAQLVPAKKIDDLVEAGQEAWLQLRQTPFLHELSAKVIDDFFAHNGKRKVVALLDDAGITAEVLTRLITDVITPVFDSAAGAKYVEGRIRARLEPFYSSYKQ